MGAYWRRYTMVLHCCTLLALIYVWPQILYDEHCEQAAMRLQASIWGTTERRQVTLVLSAIAAAARKLQAAIAGRATRLKVPQALHAARDNAARNLQAAMNGSMVRRRWEPELRALEEKDERMGEYYRQRTLFYARRNAAPLLQGWALALVMKDTEM